MGPINFARVRATLRAAKDNNEEPSKSEMFIATRTKTGKEIQADTQVAIVCFLKRIISDFNSNLKFIYCGEFDSIEF